MALVFRQRPANGVDITRLAIESRRAELAWQAADRVVSHVCAHADRCEHIDDAERLLDVYVSKRSELDALCDSWQGRAG
jgi:hypothetical protein